MYIFESNKIDSIKNKTNVYIWNGHSDKKNYLSIPNYLENNAKKFRKKYIDFIHNLGEKKILDKSLRDHLEMNNNHNLWWMSLLVEKKPL